MAYYLNLPMILLSSPPHRLSSPLSPSSHYPPYPLPPLLPLSPSSHHHSAEADKKKFHAGMNTLNRSLHGGSGTSSMQASLHGGPGGGGGGGAADNESQKSMVPFTAGHRRGTNFSGVGSVNGDDEDDSEVSLTP